MCTTHVFSCEIRLTLRAFDEKPDFVDQAFESVLHGTFFTKTCLMNQRTVGSKEVIMK